MNQETHKRKTGRRWWRTGLGLLLAGVCLLWVFHDIHPERLLDHLATIHWGWIALAVVFDILSYVTQGWRWRLLLRPVGRVSTLSATEIIYVGLFANEVLPLRVGEVIRMYMVARRMAVSFVKIIPSVALERLFDAVWLTIGVGLTAMFVPLPKDLMRAADILGAAVLIGILLFLVLVLRQRKATLMGDLPRGKIRHSLASAASRAGDGLRGIGMSQLVFSFAISFFFLFFQALAFWLVMWGYGLQLSLWVGVAVLLIVHLGTAVPNAPANVGTYQFFTVLGLALFGVEKTLATGFSVVVFVILTVPLWALGLWALSRSGMTLAMLREEGRRLKEREVTTNVGKPDGQSLSGLL